MKTLYSVMAISSVVSSHDNWHGSVYLLGNWRRHRRSIISGWRSFTEVVDYLFSSRNIPSGRPKTFGEGAHQNINISWIASPVFNNSTPSSSHCPDTLNSMLYDWIDGVSYMSFVQVQIAIILLLDSNNRRQIANGPFHWIDSGNTDAFILLSGIPFHDDKNLVVGFSSLWISGGNCISNSLFQTLGVWS